MSSNKSKSNTHSALSARKSKKSDKELRKESTTLSNCTKSANKELLSFTKKTNKH